MGAPATEVWERETIRKQDDCDYFWIYWHWHWHNFEEAYQKCLFTVSVHGFQAIFFNQI
jgi:hypothetical protein